jgi:hypothetical protein
MDRGLYYNRCSQPALSAPVLHSAQRVIDLRYVLQRPLCRVLVLLNVDTKTLCIALHRGNVYIARGLCRSLWQTLCVESLFVLLIEPLSGASDIDRE